VPVCAGLPLTCRSRSKQRRYRLQQLLWADGLPQGRDATHALLIGQRLPNMQDGKAGPPRSSVSDNLFGAEAQHTRIGDEEIEAEGGAGQVKSGMTVVCGEDDVPGVSERIGDFGE
jgi:hypothetical protein